MQEGKVDASAKIDEFIGYALDDQGKKILLIQEINGLKRKKNLNQSSIWKKNIKLNLRSSLIKPETTKTNLITLTG